MMAKHPNNIVNAMELVGCSFRDMLVAYPGKDADYLDRLLRDCSLALNRPVTSYGLLGIYPCASKYFNVSEHGFRCNGRNQPWPPVGGKVSIFVFGGSTTVGFGVEDSQTIPAKLQSFLEGLGLDCEVYNFGSGNYTSRHETLRFLDLVDQGFIPDCAIFLDGYNECFYAFGNQDLVSYLNGLYQQDKKRRRMSYPACLIDLVKWIYGVRRQDLPGAGSYVPPISDNGAQAYLSDEGIKKALQSSSRELPLHDATDFHARISKRVWERYLDSVAIIKAVARRKRVNTLFVWQPAPFYKTRKQHRVMERLYYVYRHGVFCAPVYNWLHLKHFPSMKEAPDFLNLAEIGCSTNQVLYVDICHYSVAFCEIIAEAISAKLINLFHRADGKLVRNFSAAGTSLPE